MSLYDTLLQNYLASPAAQAGIAAAEAAGSERRQATLDLLVKLRHEQDEGTCKGLWTDKDLRAWLEAGDPSPVDRVLVTAGHGSLLRAFAAKASVGALKWLADWLEGKVKKDAVKNG